MDNFDLKKYLAEGKLHEDASEAINFEEEIQSIIKQKNLQKDDKIKWEFGFSGWRDTTPKKLTGTFIRWQLLMENGMIKSFNPKNLSTAIGVVAEVKDDKINTNKISYLYYYVNGDPVSEDNQKAFETLTKNG